MMRRWLPWLLFALCAAQGVAAQKIGEVVQVAREVRHGLDGAEEKTYQLLKKRDLIVERTKVVTKKRAGAEIQVGRPPGKHGIVMLGPVTQFTFDKWIAEAMGGEYALRLYVGRVLALFWPDNGEHIVKINTPTGPVTLRGTAVYLEVSPIDHSTFVYVLEGQVTVESLAGGEVTVHAGEQTRVSVGQPPTPPAPPNSGTGPGPDLKSPGEEWLVDPPLIILDDPRLDLPK
jgi:quercetin dioxygenase-like cupin family protein